MVTGFGRDHDQPDDDLSSMFRSTGGRILDGPRWQQHIGEPLFTDLTKWADTAQINLGWSRWITEGSASGAHIAKVNVRPKNGKIWGGVLKLVPHELVHEENLNINAAKEASPRFHAARIVGMEDQCILPFTKWGLHLQRFAEPLRPLSGFASELDFGQRCGAILNSILLDWNEQGDKDDWAATPADKFLNRFVSAYSSVKDGIAQYAETEALSFDEPEFQTTYAIESLPNPLALLQGVFPVDDITIYRGNGHGDLHVDNILVHPDSSAAAPDYRLIDLGRFSHGAPISRDAVKLLLSSVEQWLMRHEGTLKDKQLFASLAMIAATGGQNPQHIPEPLNGLRETVAAIHAAAERWAATRAVTQEWRLQHHLTMVGAALRKVGATSSPQILRRWHFEVAAIAAREFLDLAPVRPAPVTAAGPARIQEPNHETGPGGSTVDEAPAPDRITSSLTWQQAAVGIAYDRLFDAQPMIDDLVALVESSTAGWAVTVSGPGGIGKTAVTYEAISNVAERGQFSKILWVSGRAKDFDEGEVDPPIDWEDVLFQIGSQLECDMQHRRLWGREVERAISKMKASERLLLVVDNLEAVHDADRLLERLARLGIGHPNKVVLASRRRLQNRGIGRPNVTVREMKQPTAVAFMHHLGREDDEMKNADAEALAPIYTITEGNPFLIKLVVSRHLNSVRSLEEILSELQTVQHGGLGAQAKNWLFDQQLEDFAARAGQRSVEQLIGAFCYFPRGESVPKDLLQEESEIDDHIEFMNLLEIARQFELVRIGRNRKEFSIHSLLYEFTCRELGAGR